LGLGLGVVPAAAAPCAADGVLQERLARGFGEVLAGRGQALAGHRLEVWSNTLRGTWTMLVITPDGLACMAASGHLHRGVPSETPAVGSVGV
jgi:hypothetical protein